MTGIESHCYKALRSDSPDSHESSTHLPSIVVGDHTFTLPLDTVNHRLYRHLAVKRRLVREKCLERHKPYVSCGRFHKGSTVRPHSPSVVEGQTGIQAMPAARPRL